jgi:outer membrane receptor for ferrienterochelin and colicins
MKYIIYVLLLFVVFSNEAFSHNHTIRGVVRTKNGDGNVIPSATVRIANTTLGTIANSKGEFVLRGIPDGKFKVLVSAIGYEPFSYEINFEHTDGDELEIEVGMVETNLTTPDLVVTATRSEKIYEDVPVKVSVLSSKILESTSSVSLRDGLSFQPGLRIESNCQNCGTSEVKMNGLGGQYSQILIDSRPVFSSLNAVYGLEQIPSNMIDRIEIVRGGGSALYGGSAIAGVINIITRDPYLNSFEAGFNQSFTNNEKSDNTINLNTSVINDKQNMGVYLFGMNRTREAWDATGDGISDIPELKVTTFGARAFYKPDYQSRIGVQYHIVSDKRRGGDKFELPYHLSDLTEAINHITNAGQISYENFIGNYTKMSSYVSMQSTNRDNYYGANQDPNGYGTTDNSTFIGGVQLSQVIPYFLGAEHIITAGYEFKYDNMNDKLTGYNLYLDQITREHGIYVQDDITMNKQVSLVLGTRVDRHNFLDDFVISPRASLLYKPWSTFTLRTSYSTGFRAPQAFNEDLHINLLAGDLQVIRMADNLKTEFSQNVNFSADFSFSIGNVPFAISTDLFYTHLDNVFVLEYVGLTEDNYLLLERRNGNVAEVQGITFELQTSLMNDFSFVAGMTYQQSKFSKSYAWFEEDEEIHTTNKLLKSPNLYGFISASKYFGKSWTLDMSAVISGPMFVPHFAGGILPDGSINELNRLRETPAFVELNGKISYIVSSAPFIEIGIGMHNIMNSFQTDKDRGVTRDPYYIYGPVRPRTMYFEMKTKL